MTKYSINLIAKKEQRLTDKVIYFLLHYLRYIIVLTQIVVITVFFLRFKLDQEIVDLKESVNQKQEIIKVTAPLVAEAKTVSKRLGEVKGVLEEQDQFANDLEHVFSNVPENIVLKSFEFSQLSLKLSGVSADIEAIRAFYDRIQKNDRFAGVVIDSITKTDFNFEFSFNVKF